MNWTWHNPPYFLGQGMHEGTRQTRHTDTQCYILKIKRLTLRVELASLYRAFRRRGAVNIDHIVLEGVQFRTQRNREADLNLWEALSLPDRDLNVGVIVAKAREQGGLRDTGTLRPLPTFATVATRKAARYWEKQKELKTKLQRQISGLQNSLSILDNAPAPRCRCRFWPAFSRPSPPVDECDQTPMASWERILTLPVPGQCFNYPIGHPLRRPQWGVPVRFDIRELVAVNVELWILDLLTMDKHVRFIEADTKMVVNYLVVSRSEFEAGDERRLGRGDVDTADGIRGVYLGELVWVLIAQLLPGLIKHSPKEVLTNGCFAACFATRDSAVTLGAMAFEFALAAKRLFSCGAGTVVRSLGEPALPPTGSFVHVRLIRAHGVAYQGQRVNVHARLEIIPGRPSDPGEHQRRGVMAAASTLRVWTKTPWWDEAFCLGPVDSEDAVLRVTCFHRKTRYAAVNESMDDDASTYLRHIGEVKLELASLNVSDTAIGRKGELVGWFPLMARTSQRPGSLEEEAHGHLLGSTDAADSQQGTARGRLKFGRLKLGLRLVNPSKVSASTPVPIEPWARRRRRAFTF